MPPARARRGGSLQTEMGQRRPFRSKRQEAAVALLRTASVVTRAFARLVEPSKLSWPQYNALRIVRGAGSGGIATLTIRERMIDEGTTITRLLDKLEAAGLIRRERSRPDRRQVLCFVTPEGRRLLDGLDPKVDALDEEVTAELSETRLTAFIGMLDDIRQATAGRGAPRHTVRAEA
jgi:MarR family transcriptional regulator, organic hydroperoxide resistance regulator